MDKKIQNLLALFKGSWYDIAGSAEVFMTEKDKRDYCEQIINQNERQKQKAIQHKDRRRNDPA